MALPVRDLSMTCTYTLTIDQDCLLADIRGTASSLSDIFEFDQAILDEGKRLGIRKMLRDVRQVTFENISPLEVTAFMEQRLALTERSLRIQIAVVYNEANWDLGKMFETAAINRSFHCRSFLDYAEALRWLACQTDSACTAHRP